MAEQFKMINLAIELSGLVLCFLGSVLAMINGTMYKLAKRYFTLSFCCLMMETVCNMAGQIMRGLPGESYRISLYVSNFGEFLFGFFMPFITTKLLLTIIDKDRKWKKMNIILWDYLFTAVILLVISQFTGLFYTIDASNVYHRSSAFFISFLLGEIIVILDVILIIRYRDMLGKRGKTAFIIYFAVPVIANIIQLFIYGIYIKLFSEIFSSLILFVFILLEQTAKYYQKEREIKDMRMAIMLSQIQPHFLYNTLDGIYYLCGSDPKTAQKAVLDFSDYLRANMASLDSPRCIPFYEELKHISAYLNLRKLSLKDRLNVVLNTEEKDFFVPPLSVQPIVENAVKHGIGKKIEGGIVTVSTRKENGYYIITVEDDGIGFDIGPSAEDGKQHIGIKNVRQRLENEVGGTLDIFSEKGKGTRAVIKIPVRREHK